MRTPPPCARAPGAGQRGPPGISATPRRGASGPAEPGPRRTRSPQCRLRPVPPIIGTAGFAPPVSGGRRLSRPSRRRRSRRRRRRRCRSPRPPDPAWPVVSPPDPASRRHRTTGGSPRSRSSWRSDAGARRDLLALGPLGLFKTYGGTPDSSGPPSGGSPQPVGQRPAAARGPYDAGMHPENRLRRQRCTPSSASATQAEYRACSSALAEYDAATADCPCPPEIVSTPTRPT